MTDSILPCLPPKYQGQIRPSYGVSVRLMGYLPISQARNNNELNLSNNQQSIYRDITQAEINNFIPINYKTVNNASDIVLIKKLIINNVNEYVLPLLPKNEFEGMVKIILLKYDKKSNNYYLQDEYDGPGNVGVDFKNIDDIDGDSIDELFVSFMESFGGSGTGNYLRVLKINNDNIEELFGIDTGFIYYSESKTIIGTSMIWDQGEGHFGCHRLEINQYRYNSDGFYLFNKLKSKFKYDFGDELDIDYKNCFPYPSNFNDLLDREGIKIK